MRAFLSLFLAALVAAFPAAMALAREPSAHVSSVQEIPAGRLPDTVRPTAYRLDLTVDPSSERFSGQAEIDVTMAQPGNRIVLHGRGLAVGKVVARIAGREIAGKWEQVDSTGVATLTFAEALPAGTATLAFDYDAGFNNGPSGLFRANVGGDWYSWSQFESIDARAAFPSFDQPSFKTPFTVTVRTPPGLMAVSNAPETGITRESGLDVHRFAPTLPLPTYLIAVMVGPFVTLEGMVPPSPQRAKPLPLRIVSTKQNAGQLDFALEGSKDIVVLLEDYFGQSFPYPKLDQITSPIMPGAMENAGADLYRVSLLIMDRAAPVEQQRRFGMVVAHELGHQWFGDLVTPAWWDDIWLNESFANWMGYRIGDAWKPELNIGAGALADGFAAMRTDALVAGRPIRHEIVTNASIDSAFDSITYGKGGHVIAMIAGYLGDDAFRAGVRRYMAAHPHGVATTDDFFASLAAAGGDPRIVPAMRSFIEQQGVPLLTFSRAGDGFSVNQQRYARFGTQAPQTLWGVPFCVRRNAQRHCQLLDEPAGSFVISGTGPIIPNAGGTGYYRFELDADGWAALIAEARSLSGGEALAVSDSLAASVLAGRAQVGQLGALAKALADHPDSYASDAAVDALAAMVRSGVVDAGGRRGWRTFRGKLYAPRIAQLGFDPRAGAYVGEAPERTQRRAQAVSAIFSTAKGAKVRKQLAKAVKAYLGGDTAALDAAWFGPAFNVYLDKRKEGAARALLEQALASEDPVFRPAALHAVASSGIRPIARWLLEEFDDPRLRPVEQRNFLADVISTRATRDIGYAWLDANFDSYVQRSGGIFAARRLPQLLSDFCSVEKADELGEKFRPRFAGTAAAVELERVVEDVRSCGELKNARGFEISEGFSSLR